MITVFHANKDIVREARDLGNGTSMESLREHYCIGNYNKAGVIDTDDLNVAFRKSQNIFWSFWGDGQQRSTSVGDLFYSDGYWWLVAPRGFEYVPMGA